MEIPMRGTALIFLMAFALIGTASAKQPAKKLTCTTAQGIKTEAELSTASGQNTNIVNVAFVGRRPGAKEIDRILRDCVRAAAKIDGTKDILGTAWLRKKAGDDPLDDEIIDNYGVLSYLSYQASTKTIEVRQMKLKGR